MQTQKEYLSGREISALRCESLGDYSLPDYNGDVKKVLAVKAKVFPTGKFVGDDLLEFSGSIGYDVVYLDSENTVTHAEFTTDYDGAVRINSETYVDSDIATYVSSCNLRLVGPRKLSVKTLLDNDVRITENKRYDIPGDAFVEMEPELSTSTVKVLSHHFARGELREYNEEILCIDGVISDEVEILLNDIEFIADSVEKLDGKIGVKGYYKTLLLYRNSNSAPQVVTKEIPVDDAIEFDGAVSIDSVDIRAEITSLKGRVEPTENGVSLVVSFSSLPVVCGVKNCELEIVSDAYLKECGTDNEYSEFGYTEHICTESSEDKFEARVPLSELGVEEVNDIIWCEGVPRVEKCDFNGKSVEIIGEIKFSAIACQVNEDGDKLFCPIKINAPFTQNVNVSCQMNENIHLNCHLDCLECKIEVDSNHALASCVLSTHVTVNSQKRQRCLGSSYLTNEEYSRDESIVTVYYPDRSESLFDIAKKFHTSVSSIAESNRLTQAVFASSLEPLGSFEIKKLIIK